MEKATRQQTKNHNSSLILRTIYSVGNISRADISRETGLTRPTVSNLVSELIDQAYVIETGVGPAAVGKPPTLLNIAYNAHNLLCIDLSSQEFCGSLLNLRGDIVLRATLMRIDQMGADAVQLVVELIDYLIGQLSVPLLGIGIGTPGLVDPLNGIVVQAVNLGWSRLKLRESLEARYRQPVYISNDSHVAALAEYTYGRQTSSKNLILIQIAQGVGAGVVLNGKAYYGDGFGAGEIGHIVTDENGELCSCGKFGCLETASSARAILAHAAAVVGRPDFTWEELVAMVEAGDSALTEIVVTAGIHLGIAVASLIVDFNVHEIVISGRVSEFGDLFLDAVIAAARDRILPQMADETTLRFSELGSDIVLLGCSAMVLQEELGVV